MAIPAGVGLIVIAALYSQTGHAFQHIILPLVAGRLKADLSAGRGSISLTGRLRVQDLTYADAQGRSAAIRALEVRVAPMSLFGGEGPIIRSARLESPRLVLLSPPKANDAATPRSTGPRSAATATEATTAPTRPPEAPLIPVAIQELEITDLSAELRRPRAEADRTGPSPRADTGLAGRSLEATAWRLQGGRIALSGLERGGTARLSVTSGIQLAPDDPARARSGRLEADLRLDQDPSGRRLEATGRARAEGFGEPTSAGDPGSPQSLAFEAETALTTEGRASAQARLRIVSAAGERSAGHVDVALDWRARQGRQPTHLEASLEVAEVDETFLNPILAALGSASLEHARLDGNAKVETEGERYRVEARLAGENLSLRAESGPTPPMTFQFTEIGDYDADSRTLGLETAAIELRRSEQPIVVAGLDQPLRLRLDKDAAPGSAPEAPARFNVEIRDLGVEDVRPWVDAAGSTALDGVRQGTSEGRLAIAALETGRSLAFEGSLLVRDLIIDREIEPLFASSDEPPEIRRAGPLRVQNTLSGELVNLERLSLTRWTMGLAADAPGARERASRSGDASNGPALARIDLTGEYDLSTHDGAFAIDLTTPDAAEATRRLGILAESAARDLRGGDMKSHFTLQRQSESPGWTIEGRAAVNALGVAAEGRQPLLRSLAVTNRVRTDPQAQILNLDRMDIDLTDDGDRAAGHASLTGTWPLAARASDADSTAQGRLKLTVRDFLAGPWIEHFGWAEGRQFGPTPVRADIALTLDPVGQTLTSEGEIEIESLRLASGEEPPEEVALSLRHRLKKVEEEIADLLIELTSSRGARPAGRAEIRGVARLDGRPRARLEGRVRSLDAALLMGFLPAPAEAPAGAQSTAAPSRPAASASDAAAPEPEGILPLDVEATFTLDRVTYRELLLEAGRGRLTAEGPSFKVVLDPTSLNGGRLQGEFEYRRAGAEPAVAWRAQGEGIDARPLLASFKPSMADQISGAAIFNTQGTGAGTGAEFKRRLEGSLAFEVSGGQFGRSRLFDLIADQTKVDVFRQMKFSTFTAEAEFRDGWAHLKRVHVSGPATQVVADGRVGLNGHLDLRVFPRVSTAQLGQKISSNRYVGALLQAGDGFTDFPFAISVGGTVDDPAYGVTVKPPDLKDALDNIRRGVGDLLRRGLR